MKNLQKMKKEADLISEKLLFSGVIGFNSIALLMFVLLISISAKVISKVR